MKHLTPLLAFTILLPTVVRAADTAPTTQPLTWTSPTTHTPIPLKLLEPPTPSQPTPLILYLTNLSTPRLGREPDAPILADLVSQGHLIAVLDYANHPSATSPALNADILQLRQDLLAHKLLADRKIDLAHVFILPEGYRLRRDVVFAHDGPRTLAMDIQYPAAPPHPVPSLLEFTCDNKDRMGTYSLVYCHDTLLDGAQLQGFAVAMADHPVPPPYKGLDDPMPDCIYRLKAAVRTLRAVSPDIHSTGQIGAIGFSRGGPMAAILAVTNNRPDLEAPPNATQPAAHPDTPSTIQAALIHGNRYDYLDLIEKDPMIPRFEKALGKRPEHDAAWAAHGAAYYLTPESAPTAAPFFLNTSAAESPEYRHGLAQFDKTLTRFNIEHTYQVDDDTRGHKVTTDPKTLSAVYSFFSQHLSPNPKTPR